MLTAKEVMSLNVTERFVSTQYSITQAWLKTWEPMRSCSTRLLVDYQRAVLFLFGKFLFSFTKAIHVSRQHITCYHQQPLNLAQNTNKTINTEKIKTDIKSKMSKIKCKKLWT